MLRALYTAPNPPSAIFSYSIKSDKYLKEQINSFYFNNFKLILNYIKYKK